MPGVTLRRLHSSDHELVLGIRPHPSQGHLIASVEDSLAEVDADDALTAFAVYDGSQLGLPEPELPPVGFAVTDVIASVGWQTPFTPPPGEVYLCLSR